jgi:hypothetical protein
MGFGAPNLFSGLEIVPMALHQSPSDFGEYSFLTQTHPDPAHSQAVRPASLDRIIVADIAATS